MPVLDHPDNKDFYLLPEAIDVQVFLDLSHACFNPAVERILSFRFKQKMPCIGIAQEFTCC